MTPRIYVALALLGILAAGLGSAYIKGRSDAANKATITRLETDLRVERDAASRERAARRQDQILADTESLRQAERDVRLTELEQYVDTLEDKLRVVLSASDVDQLRKSAWGQH